MDKQAIGAVIILAATAIIACALMISRYLMLRRKHAFCAMIRAEFKKTQMGVYQKQVQEQQDYIVYLHRMLTDRGYGAMSMIEFQRHGHIPDESLGMEEIAEHIEQYETEDVHVHPSYL